MFQFNIIFIIKNLYDHNNHCHQLDDEESEEESSLVPSLLTDQLSIDDAVRPYDLVGN